MLNYVLGVLPFLIAIGCKAFVDHFWRLSAILCAIIIFMATNLTIVNHLASSTPVTGTAGMRMRIKRLLQVRTGTYYHFC